MYHAVESIKREADPNFLGVGIGVDPGAKYPGGATGSIDCAIRTALNVVVAFFGS